MEKSGMTGGLLAPLANKAESRARTTDTIFRSIVSAEAAARDAKTERLRLARLSLEAAAPAPEPTAKKRVVKAAPIKAAKAVKAVKKAAKKG
jgi:hypothetical protein